MNHKKASFFVSSATEVCTRIMREFNANYFKPLFLKKKEMSPNMCFAAVVFQTVQIALKTGREFLQLLVFSSVCIGIQVKISNCSEILVRSMVG